MPFCLKYVRSEETSLYGKMIQRIHITDFTLCSLYLLYLSSGVLEACCIFFDCSSPIGSFSYFRLPTNGNHFYPHKVVFELIFELTTWGSTWFICRCELKEDDLLCLAFRQHVLLIDVVGISWWFLGSPPVGPFIWWNISNLRISLRQSTQVSQPYSKLQRFVGLCVWWFVLAQDSRRLLEIASCMLHERPWFDYRRLFH